MTCCLNENGKNGNKNRKRVEMEIIMEKGWEWKEWKQLWKKCVLKGWE